MIVKVVGANGSVTFYERRFAPQRFDPVNHTPATQITKTVVFASNRSVPPADAYIVFAAPPADPTTRFLSEDRFVRLLPGERVPDLLLRLFGDSPDTRLRMGVQELAGPPLAPLLLRYLDSSDQQSVLGLYPPERRASVMQLAMQRYDPLPHLMGYFVDTQSFVFLDMDRNVFVVVDASNRERRIMIPTQNREMAKYKNTVVTAVHEAFHVRSVADPSRVQTVRPIGVVRGFKVSSALLVCFTDDYVFAWRLDSLALVGSFRDARWPQDDTISHITVHDMLVACGTTNGKLCIWNAATNEVVMRFDPDGYPVEQDPNDVHYGEDDGLVNTTNILWTASMACFSADGTRFVSDFVNSHADNEPNHLVFWKLQHGLFVIVQDYEFPDMDDNPWNLQFSQDGQQLLVHATSRKVYLLNVQNLDEIKKRRTFQFEINEETNVVSASFSEDERRVYAMTNREGVLTFVL